MHYRGKEKIVAYLKTWPTNMGNVFIDLGALECLRKAAPQAQIHAFGGLGRRLLYAETLPAHEKARMHFVNALALARSVLERNRERWIPKGHYRRIVIKGSETVRNLFDISLALKTDFAVISGCILTNQLGLFLPTLTGLTKRNTRIILNAVGGNDYSEAEVETIREFLEELKPYAIISRDRDTFKNYHDLAEHSYDGIDAAFLMSDSFRPPRLNLPEYAVLNFDGQEEPNLDLHCDLILRTSHRTYPAIVGTLSRKIYRRQNLLVSDDPRDYCTLYANAKEVHSDRVHACVVTLSYGKPCRLYFETDRAGLLDRLGAGNVRDRLTRLDCGKLQRERIAQMNFLGDIIYAS